MSQALMSFELAEGFALKNGFNKIKKGKAVHAKVVFIVCLSLFFQETGIPEFRQTSNPELF